MKIVIVSGIVGQALLPGRHSKIKKGGRDVPKETLVQAAPHLKVTEFVEPSLAPP